MSERDSDRERDIQELDRMAFDLKVLQDNFSIEREYRLKAEKELAALMHGGARPEDQGEMEALRIEVNELRSKLREASSRSKEVVTDATEVFSVIEKLRGESDSNRAVRMAGAVAIKPEVEADLEALREFIIETTRKEFFNVADAQNVLTRRLDTLCEIIYPIRDAYSTNAQNLAKLEHTLRGFLKAEIANDMRDFFRPLVEKRCTFCDGLLDNGYCSNSECEG